MTETKGRALSRNETHDLGMIIKDRAKVLKAHVEHQAASVISDFERQLAAIYSFDSDEKWARALREATVAVHASNEIVAKRCEELGIPKAFAPSIAVGWIGRGQGAVSERRIELRRVAKSSVDEMSKEAVLKIERQSLDLRTQVVALGLLSDQAKFFLESLAPVEEAMQMLRFDDIEKRLDGQKTNRRRMLGYE